MKHRDVVVIAASTGGFDALKELVSSWPVDLPASLFVVMHIGAHRSILAQLLQKETLIPVRYAVHEEDIRESVIYVAPSDQHLLIQDGKTHLTSGPKENFTRPAADPLFRSAAINYGARVIGVVLTGDLDDGAAGLRAIRACGGAAVVQEPAECPAPSMPLCALDEVPDAIVAPIAKLGSVVSDLLHQPLMAPVPNDPSARRVAEIENRIGITGVSDPSELRAIGELSDLTCPECAGVIWKIDGGALRYRCHTGHAFSALSLEDAQRRESEEALWSVIRGLQERISLAYAVLATGTQETAEELKARISRLKSAEETVRQLLKLE